MGRIAADSARAWLRARLHALDAERHVRIHDLVKPGSQDLRMLFARHEGRDVVLANDTSVGVGHAPLSAADRLASIPGLVDAFVSGCIEPF